MTTAPLALLDLADRAGCPPAQGRHRLDCLVRWLLTNGWDGEALDIHAGIGRLRIGGGQQVWEPVTPQMKAPVPLPAPPELEAARRTVCGACSRWKANRCEVSGCGCAGLGDVSHLLSKCPLGKWEK